MDGGVRSQHCGRFGCRGPCAPSHRCVPAACRRSEIVVRVVAGVVVAVVFGGTASGQRALRTAFVPHRLRSSGCAAVPFASSSSPSSSPVSSLAMSPNDNVVAGADVVVVPPAILDAITSSSASLSPPSLEASEASSCVSSLLCADYASQHLQHQKQPNAADMLIDPLLDVDDEDDSDDDTDDAAINGAPVLIVCDDALVASTPAPASASASSVPEVVTPLLAKKREPLRFVFSGYTIWLHLEQTPTNDLHGAIDDVAARHGLLPIPEPHVTVTYGMTHLDEDSVRSRFRTGVKDVLATRTGWGGRPWPPLRVKGLLFDQCWDGVDGETMDMAWMELTLATSPEHEELVDAVCNVFRIDNVQDDSNITTDTTSSTQEQRQQQPPLRTGPWMPHLSLAYDNPDDDTPLSLAEAYRVVSSYPSLVDVPERNVTAISLWKTLGTMEEWTQLDRIELG